MASIPGISGYIQPGTFAKDEVISRGISVPGGLRIPCIMGEGLREEIVVEAAQGDGQDGDGSCSPTGLPSGRYFKLANSPVISGRTELYLNGNLLRGVEDAIDSASFDGKFDFRIDPTTGCFELQGASIGDQDGKKYSASTINTGNGILIDDTCGTFDLISVLDENAPGERWTVRAIGVIRDSNGDPIPGQTTFTVSGSVSGQLTDSFGQPILFHDSYYTSALGAVSGVQTPCDDGFVVADSADFSVGTAVPLPGDATPLTTRYFSFSGDLVAQGQALVGDTLCIDTVTSGIEITDISYDSGTTTTTITVKTDSIDATLSGIGWNIRAINILVDDETDIHDGTTGLPTTDGSFTSSSVGKVLAICSGNSQGLYEVIAVTSTRRIRVISISDDSLGFPASLVDTDSDGLAETGLTFHMLETNGVIIFGIEPGNVPFAVGDKFFIDVNSKILKANDKVEARYIAVSDINDPEFFLSAAELAVKHGRETVTNTLSLGSRLCFENQAPFVLAIQCKPPIPRRTRVTLLEEVDSNGDGGFSACGGDAADCEPDDLSFLIPLPLSGLQKARPDIDTQVNIFLVRGGAETQIFPNKVGFYNSLLESDSGQAAFISSSDSAYSYTVINSGTKITGQGVGGSISVSEGTFSTTELDFDSDQVGEVIVIRSLETPASSLLTVADDISNHLFGVTTVGIELVITEIVDDNTVKVLGNVIALPSVIADAQNIQFFVKDTSDTSNLSTSLLIHRDLVSSGTMQLGDGIKISYVDEVDSDFFDTNWFEAFEAIEAEDCQMVIPLPLQNRGGIFRAAVQHVETMSTITIQKERITMFGAQQGVTVNALLGLEEIAVEDIGVLEGIQGDSPEEVLDGNTEDLQNFKLSDNYTGNRSVYFYPDQIVRPIDGSNVFIDGFYLAACAAGFFSRTQSPAIPLTFKDLAGFSILRDKKYRPVILNQLGAVGCTVVQPIIGGGRVLAGRTNSTSGNIEDEEISIVFIRDAVKLAMRAGMQRFVGTVEDANTIGVMTTFAIGIMSSLVSKGLVNQFENVRVERDKIDPRQYNIYCRYQPNYPINFVFVSLEVGIL